MNKLDEIRVAHVMPDYLGRHSYDEWKSMGFDKMCYEAGVEIYTLDEFETAFNFDEISDLSYIFFYEI